MKTKFEIGDAFSSTDIFSGGRSFYTVEKIENKKLICKSKNYEADGIHTITDQFKIEEDEQGEYIILWEYHGESAVLRASELGKKEV